MGLTDWRQRLFDPRLIIFAVVMASADMTLGMVGDVNQQTGTLVVAFVCQRPRASPENSRRSPEFVRCSAYRSSSSGEQIVALRIGVDFRFRAATAEPLVIFLRIREQAILGCVRL